MQCCVGEQRMDIHAGDGLFINQNTLHSFALTSGDRMVSLVFSPQFLAIPYANIYTAYIEPVLTSNLYVISLSSSVEQERAILQKIQYIAQIDHGESPTKELDTYIAVLELWRSFFITMFSGHSFTANQGFFSNAAAHEAYAGLHRAKLRAENHLKRHCRMRPHQQGAKPCAVLTDCCTAVPFSI